jgi:hypothetical protein
MRVEVGLQPLLRAQEAGAVPELEAAVAEAVVERKY